MHSNQLFNDDGTYVVLLSASPPQHHGYRKQGETDCRFGDVGTQWCGRCPKVPSQEIEVGGGDFAVGVEIAHLPSGAAECAVVAGKGVKVQGVHHVVEVGIARCRRDQASAASDDLEG